MVAFIESGNAPDASYGLDLSNPNHRLGLCTFSVPDAPVAGSWDRALVVLCLGYRVFCRAGGVVHGRTTGFYRRTYSLPLPLRTTGVYCRRTALPTSLGKVCYHPFRGSHRGWPHTPDRMRQL